MNEHVRHAWERGLAVLAPTKADLDHGLELHRRSIVVDAYGFTALTTPSDLGDQVERAYEAGATSHDLNQLIHCLRANGIVRDEAARREYEDVVRHSGVTCVVQNAGEGRNVFESLERMSFFTYVCDELSGTVSKAVSADDVEAAKKAGRHCLMFSLNNPIMDQHWDFWHDEMKWMRTFHRCGVRIMHLTYNRRNRCGDGCAEPADSGLSEYGNDVVHEFNRLGIIVDVAHCGQQTSYEAAHASRKPIVASHSGSRALNDHVRNKTDRVIRAICDSGGYVGVCAIAPFLGRSCDVAALLDHVDHIARTFGTDHVAIGCDITYEPPLPDEIGRIRGLLKSKRSFWSHWPPDEPVIEPGALNESLTGSLAWSNWPLFTVGLVQRGYSDDDVRKIIGGNCLRVMRENF
ncbi:MAG: dipeptidase [Phycisphaeraceae bacterium]|nr:dipeptidase [Phycisphaeraceae bacterium]